MWQAEKQGVELMITLTNGKLTAEIDELGAQLSKLYTKDIHYLWEGPAEIWPKHSPVLFPFVGRLPDGKYHYRGKEFCNVPIHGFAPTSMFDCIENTGFSCKMRMVADERVKQGYPFDFEFCVFYEIDGNSIKITYQVKNVSSEEMYYGMGSHPGFNVPIKAGLKFEDYYLEFPDAGVIRRHLTDENCLQLDEVQDYEKAQGNIIRLDHSLFDNDAVILENTGNRVLVKTEKDSSFIEVKYPDTKWCAIWHKVKAEVPFVCIEPWFSLMGLPDGVNEISQRRDFFRLERGQINRHNLTISVY